MRLAKQSQIFFSTECRVFHNVTFWLIKYTYFTQMMCYYLNVHFQDQTVKSLIKMCQHEPYDRPRKLRTSWTVSHLSSFIFGTVFPLLNHFKILNRSFATFETWITFKGLLILASSRKSYIKDFVCLRRWVFKDQRKLDAHHLFLKVCLLLDYKYCRVNWKETRLNVTCTKTQIFITATLATLIYKNSTQRCLEAHKFIISG